MGEITIKKTKSTTVRFLRKGVNVKLLLVFGRYARTGGVREILWGVVFGKGKGIQHVVAGNVSLTVPDGGDAAAAAAEDAADGMKKLELE